MLDARIHRPFVEGADLGALSRLAVTVTAISLVVIAANIHSLVLLAPPGAGEMWERISVLSHGIQPMSALVPLAPAGCPPRRRQSQRG